MIELVYLSRDNPVTIELREDTTLIPWAGVTRMLLTLEGSAVVADSDIAAELFDWTTGDGVLVLNLNDLAVTAGQYRATLVVYDATHPDGQVLVHKHSSDLLLLFLD